MCYDHSIHSVGDGGPILNQHWASISCLLGWQLYEILFRTNEIIFRTDEILFRTNEIKKNNTLNPLTAGVAYIRVIIFY